MTEKAIVVDDDLVTEEMISGRPSDDGGIPDVSDASMGIFRRQAQRIEEDEEETEEAEEEESDAGEEPGISDEEVSRAIAELKPDNPWWARNRILETEKKRGFQERDTEIEKLRAELSATRDLFKQILEGAKESGEQAAEEAGYDPMDPLGSVMQGMEKINKKLVALEEKEAREREEQAKSAAVASVDVAIAKARSEYPVFEAAFRHLSKVLAGNMKRKMPDAPERERIREAAKAVKEMKYQWLNSGANPLDEMMDLAIDTGFDMELFEKSRQDHAPAAPASKRTARVQENPAVSRMKKAPLASLGNTPGSAPKGFNAKMFSKKNEREFNWEVDHMLEQGVLKAKRTLGKTPSFSDLLPGKGIAKE